MAEEEVLFGLPFPIQIEQEDAQFGGKLCLECLPLFFGVCFSCLVDD